MNPRQLIVAAAMLAATVTGFAQETESVDPAAGFVSSKTRAQVMEELKQAQADGSYVMPGSEEFSGQYEILARAHRQHREMPGLARDSESQPVASGS
jgi:hypothetical protein